MHWPSWLVSGLQVPYLGHVHLEYESTELLLFGECLFSILGIIRHLSRITVAK